MDRFNPKFEDPVFSNLNDCKTQGSCPCPPSLRYGGQAFRPGVKNALPSNVKGFSPSCVNSGKGKELLMDKKYAVKYKRMP